jgi:hypothetical protein
MRRFAIILFASFAVFLSGCVSTPGSGSTSSVPVGIEIQPLSQIIPIGESATFAVTAYGSAPLSYQWSENGTKIAGATGPSYTTAPVELGNGGSTSIGTFQVTVSNASSSIASNSVTLTAGARSPKAGDLRYLLNEQIDLPGLMTKYGVGGGILWATEGYITDTVGTPLTLGQG